MDEKLKQARLEISGKHEELEAQKLTDEKLKLDFDFDKYTFYDNATMYKIKYITEEYVKQGQLNSNKIRKLLIHSIYDMVTK